MHVILRGSKEDPIIGRLRGEQHPPISGGLPNSVPRTPGGFLRARLPWRTISHMRHLSVARVPMMERRWEPRVPLKVRLHEVLGEHVVPSVALDMSEGGLQVRRLVETATR